MRDKMVREPEFNTSWLHPEKLIYRAMAGILILIVAGFGTALTFRDDRMLTRMIVSTAINLTGFLITCFFITKQRTDVASKVIIAAIWLANTSQLIIAGSFRQGQGFTYIIIMALAGILVGTRATILVGVLSIAAVSLGYFWELSDFVTWSALNENLWVDWGTLFMSLAVATYILQVIVNVMTESFEVAQKNQEKMVNEQRRLLEQNLKRRKTERSLQETNAALAATQQTLEERVAKRTRELAEANQGLETLLYVTSHDLREPLRAIQNFSQIVLRRHNAELGKNGAEQLGAVAVAANRLDSLIEDILTLSRAQRLIVPQENFPGSRIIKMALRRLQNEITATNAIIEVGEDMPELFVDLNWAVEAVYHVLLNALQYSDNLPEPYVLIDSGWDPAGPYLTITDHGKGIPQKQQQDIFKLFHKTDTSDPNSVGAGLTLVKQIMEKHGGAVTISSDINKGTTVQLSFQPAQQLVKGELVR